MLLLQLSPSLRWSPSAIAPLLSHPPTEPPWTPLAHGGSLSIHLISLMDTRAMSPSTAQRIV